ncbi:hypothetical protein ACFL0H_14330 [Thermodesulfobacteriota bacterium]
MTHEDEGHFAKKHPPDLKPKPETVEAVKKKASGGKISCAAAFKVVRDMNITPAEAGFTIDYIEIKINKCQMGIFGYEPGNKFVKSMDEVPGGLKDAIEQAVTGGRLSCNAAWEIANGLGIGKMDVSAACETMKTKISPCQLGAF